MVEILGTILGVVFLVLCITGSKDLSENNKK